MHALVGEVVERYLAGVGRHTDGLIEGLYLVGSVALDDFRPGTSDVDFVAVTARPVQDKDIEALRLVHAQMPRRPCLDGIYVTWADLARDPELAAPGAGVHDGRLHRRDSGGDPIAWHTLAEHGVAVHGPVPEVWTSRAALTAWSRCNLDDYWAPWLRRSRRLWSGPGLACVHPWGPAWGVLGISRLHHTVATGAITSKYGAGRYAREVFDGRWERIVDECLRLRSGEGRRRYANPLARRRDALDFAAMAIDATRSLPGQL